MLLLLVQLASAACPSSPESLARDAERVATEGGDAAAVRREAECLAGPITPGGAIWLHRVAAIERLAARDTGNAMTHLRATPPGWEPADPELARLVAAQSQAGSTAPREAVVVPAGWRALIDGQEASGRPTDRAVLFQWMDATRRVRSSTLLLPTDPVPPAPLGGGPALEVAPTPDPWIAEGKNQALVGGAVALAAGIGLVTAGLGVRGSLPEPASGGADPAYVDEVRRKRSTANALGWAGQGVGLAGVGLVVATRVSF